MDIRLSLTSAKGYRINSQIARVITENWVKQNSYCPSCGNNHLSQFGNNAPVADFLCSGCMAEYELKSKKNHFTLRVVDGAYKTMIQRINSYNNPNFFFLHYSEKNLEVLNFLVIPRHFFVNNIIERRAPLAKNARRAGWIGCSILLQNIPLSGRIFLIRDGKPQKKKDVLGMWSKTSFLAKQKTESRGWTIEIMRIVDALTSSSFSLKDMYQFESSLKRKFPGNNFIKDKIRQQLQVLRDKGIIEFRGNGSYTKTL